MSTEHDFDYQQGTLTSEWPPTNGNVTPMGQAVSIDVGPAVVTIAGLEDVAWRPSYDRESVARYLEAVEAEKCRLRAEIRLAEERAAAARDESRSSSTERDALLGALLLAARAEIDRVDTEHRASVSAIHALAEKEAASIRDRAQASATAVHEVVASLTVGTGPGESTEGALTESVDDAAGDPGSLDQSHAG